ncbi:acetyl esterase/lipase [Anoxybacillus tepidamans]|uniref:Acetyl esterase/lipase n=1 Tax=Anoxybacteroides tepidamans TaxID=265948 RepID=A0A7W8IM25_9BACL|nr:alpha/beta hydrolase fold domain-containing protein [Anoxybacillus tepidamans]MBB5322939.1 acetyl esterase/lipase [Anoxybacillus tepidamans]
MPRLQSALQIVFYRYAEKYGICADQIAVAGNSAGGNLATVRAMTDAEFDYLRLEVEAYARKLAKFSVKTKMIPYKGIFIDKIGIYPLDRRLYQ